ncbi:GNAT family N-acetyltransferase [Streptomyces sp. NPDC057702]|uniref:GNAT family N-acetyltransferase n=1 Tax=unclassified Streptomyces TaxID=2593676 RepID=UPI0036B51164
MRARLTELPTPGRAADTRVAPGGSGGGVDADPAHDQASRPTARHDAAGSAPTAPTSDGVASASRSTAARAAPPPEPACAPPAPRVAGRPHPPPSPARAASPLGDLARWGPATTPCGTFRLVPVSLSRDLPRITRWMNDPSVAAFWELAGPDQTTERHLRAQLDGDGRSLPCLGVLDGVPVSYWEVYRADLDPLAQHYPARPHDIGLHLLIGGVADRGRGIGTSLLRAVADLVLDHRPDCGRVIAEPDLRNTPSIAAFLGAGYRFSAEVSLPDKSAALMVRDRALRHLL